MDPFGGFAVMMLGNALISGRKARRDGSFADQQNLVADIRAREMEAAELRTQARDERLAAQRSRESAAHHERAKELAERTQQYNLERDVQQHHHRIREGELAFDRQVRLAVVQAKLQLAVQDETRRRTVEEQNSPFHEVMSSVRERLFERTDDGQLPALLIAPMDYEDNTAGTIAPLFNNAIEFGWKDAPWADDMTTMGGLFARPLRNSDVDVQTISRLLSDLPIVLVYGHVEANARLRLSVATWNVPQMGQPSLLETRFPPIILPALQGQDPDVQTKRLELQDAVGELASFLAAAHAEWFHVVSRGRLPRLHTLLPNDWTAERRAIAATSAELYAITAKDHAVSDQRAMLVSAVTLAEGGLVDESLDLIELLYESSGDPFAIPRIPGAAKPSDALGAKLLDKLIAAIQAEPDLQVRERLQGRIDGIRISAINKRLEP